MHPQAPESVRYRVKARFKDFIAQRFGVLYANASLSRRRSDGPHDFFAPVTVGPGDVPVYSWPAVALREDWLERVVEHDQCQVDWQKALA